MIKRLIAFLLALVIVLALAACTPDDTDIPGGDDPSGDIPCDRCVDTDGDCFCDVCGEGMIVPPSPPPANEDEDDGDGDGNGNGITVNPDGSFDLPGDTFD